jgi:hypothetical protein
VLLFAEEIVNKLTRCSSSSELFGVSLSNEDWEKSRSDGAK